MTLFRLMLAAVMLVGAVAQAYIVPGPGRPGNGRGDYVRPDEPGRPGRPGRPERPVRPGNPGDHYGPVHPLPPEHGGYVPYPGDGYGPGYPGDNYGPGYGDRRIETVFVGRYLRNEYLDLMRNVAHLRGYRVEEVRVYIQRSREVNASIDLIVNRRPEDSARADVGYAVTLNPRSLLEIGRHLTSLDLYARGEMLIDRVDITLTSDGGGHRPPPYDDGREVIVPLNLPSYFPPQTHLDLTPYIDLRRYRGYVVRGLELTAVARFNTASLDVMINSFSQGSVYLTTRQSTQVVRSRQNFVIGSSFGNLTLAPRGDSNIIRARLILSR